MHAFVEIALTPRPTKVDDITDPELIEIITYVVSGHASVSEQDYWLEFLDRNLSHLGIVDLVYHRSDLATPAEILAEAKSYEPIILPERLEQICTPPHCDSVEES